MVGRGNDEQIYSSSTEPYFCFTFGVLYAGVHAAEVSRTFGILISPPVLSLPFYIFCLLCDNVTGLFLVSRDWNDAMSCACMRSERI